jgi:hypothetical protein
MDFVLKQLQRFADLFITVIIPINTTLLSIYYRKINQIKLWAIYWAFFYGFK